MKIGLLVPMSEEIELIIGRMEIEEMIVLGKTSYYVGKLVDRSCVIAMSGIGKVAAAITATILIEHFKVDIILVTGTAGGVGKEVMIGDICIAKESVQHDMDASPVYPKFHIPLLGIDRFVTDNELTDLAVTAATDFLKSDFKTTISGHLKQRFNLHNPKIHVGLLASGDQFITDNLKLKKLQEGLHSLIFVEMEGAAVAQVCHEFTIPLLNVRTISDNADAEAHVNFPDFLQYASKYYTFGIISQIVRRL